MRILLVHNYYQSSAPSGEDVVFRTERDLLERAGHEVTTYTRANDDIGPSGRERARAAADLFWSGSTLGDISRLVAAHRPEVAHFHNTFPLISPSAYHACHEVGVPVVQTLHNYRLVCPGALLLRNGKPCEDCVGRLPLPGVLHGCYRGSRAATALVTGMLALHRARGTYARQVDRYLCLTDFARQRFVRGGLPADRLFLKPNTLLDPPEPGDGGDGHALYIGRLTREKGVHTLVEAWEGVATKLKIVGDGALRAELESQARARQLNIDFVGFQAKPVVYELLRKAALLVVPSECYESALPLAAIEALATGTPLLVPRMGPLDAELEEPGNALKYAPGDPGDLRDKALAMLAAPQLLRSMRLANRATFEQRYSPERVLEQQLQHYRAVASRPVA